MERLIIMINETYDKIEYYLYHYDYIDTKIKNIRLDISTSEYNHSYYKWIKNKSSSLEDQVIRNIGIEQRIYKLRRWKNLITFILEWYKKTDMTKYNFIKLKYLEKANFIKIHEKLKLNLKKQEDIRIEILQYIFFIAINEGILREVND